MQGILAIQASVSAGTTDYDAAVETLVEIYGFSKEVSERLLGNPVDLKPTEAVIK